jgi:hypothetical protein
VVKFKVRAPRHSEGRQPPRRHRRGDPHLYVEYTRSRRTKRVYLASARLPPAEDEAAAFLRMCEAKLREIGLRDASIGLEIAKVRARLTLEARNEKARIVGLRRARVEQRVADEARGPSSFSAAAGPPEGISR